MSGSGREILLIDDDQEQLDSLVGQVRDRVDSAEVRKWYPREDEDPSEAFAERTGDDTVLVATDYDLSTAVKGLFGHSVVGWCRNQFIPVGDFSRGHIEALPTEPDLFELRVPREERAAVDYIARMFEGFREIREGIEKRPALLRDGTSPAQVLAVLLGREELESQLGPYFSRPGLFNSSLLDTLKDDGHCTDGVNAAHKTRLLTYILGHVLANAVLKYPGPILAEEPLCAYLATSSKDIEDVAGLFKDARYTGPFNGGERLYWRDKVDETVESLALRDNVDDRLYPSFGDYHRAVIDKAIPRQLANHDCNRCHGVKGGFWCPFTRRAVCEWSDCSSTASSWVPSGADVCRVERGFFDEWSPILGL